MHQYKCFLDMDGVIADFVSGICKAHNRINPYLDPTNHGIWDMEKLWGITPTEFWRPVASNPNFWKTLDKTTEADAIVEAVTSVFGVDNIAILTAPSSDPYVIPEKRAWVKRYYPDLASQMIFTGAKQFLSGSNRLLIDDRDKNIQDFWKAGGAVILLPRPWNAGHGMDTMKTLKEGLGNFSRLENKDVEGVAI